jgi:hypothetical protein
MSEGGFPFLHTTRRRGPRLLRGKVGAGRLRIWNVFLVGCRTANQQPAGHTEDSAVTLASGKSLCSFEQHAVNH